MFSFKWIYFVIFTLILCESKAEISDKRLCLDENCSEIISVGKTLLRYASPEEYVLSFAPNEVVNVYSYGAGTRPELVGVEIKGKRGYINKNHFRETNLIKRPKLLIDTEMVKRKSEVPLEGAAANIKADPTRQPFEIVDGTRIPLDLDSFSTEAPAVVSEESSGETTIPLNSVPVNQNVKPAVPRELNVLNTEQNKNIGNQQQQKTEPLNKREEDSDKEEDDSDDEDLEDDEDDDEENESENKNSEAPEKDSFINVVEDVLGKNSGVVDNDDIQNNAGAGNNVPNINNVGSNVENKNDDVINKDSTVDHGNVSPNEKISVQSSQNNDSSDNIPASATEKKQILPEYVKDITGHIKEEFIEASQKEADVTKTNTEGSLPLANILDAMSKESNIENLKEYKEIDNAENIKKDKDVIENTLDKTKESKSAEEPQSLPISSTATPIDLEAEAMPPVNLDIVTPNPVHSPDINNLVEDNKNDTEKIDNPSLSLSTELMPEFKDPEEGVDIKVKEKSGGGFFGGLGGILPIFNSGDDREIGEESTPPHSIPPDNTQNEVSGDIEHATLPVDSESSFSNDNSAPKQGDFSNFNNSEEVVENNEPVVLENYEQNDLPQNSEASEKDYNIESASSNIEKITENEKESPGGIFSSIISFFHGESNKNYVKRDVDKETSKEYSASAFSDIYRPETKELNERTVMDTHDHNPWPFQNPPEKSNDEFCDKENCPKYQGETVKDNKEKTSRSNSLNAEDLQVLFIEAVSSDLFLYLTTTALSVIFLVFGMVIMDKCRREGPLIARINKLEQQLLTTVKENEMLQEKNTTFVEEKTQLVIETVPNEVVDELNQKLAEMHQTKLLLEEQIQALEKELDTSTEVGIELNKILSEMLNSSDGSEIIKENIEQMQKKLLEQQDTINTINNTLSVKETENYELRLEMEISNRKVTDLQSELDRLVEKILKIEEERDHQHSVLENDIKVYQTRCKDAFTKEQTLNSEIQVLKQQLTKFQRLSEVKIREYNSLKENLNELKAVKNNKDVLKSLLEVSEIKAQLEQLKSENLKYSEQLLQGREANIAYGAKIANLTQEANELREKYDKSDKEKVEINTKLQVLNNYFKEKEDQMQKEISRYESLWAVKEGEATSTTERIRYMQEELQNFKAQNESLKQEIVNQEVELKSQISMLEKKAHESWVMNRQTERKLEEARQEAAQLRNRLTLRERAIAEGSNQTRIQSPLHQNGELPISPLPMDPTQSPPPLFNPRDHLAKSPPIPGMPPPPFLPPPLGATPFIPPPPLEGMMPPMGDMGGMPPHFMPPLPPGMYPGDHRPPPLGRMSSPPPVGGRYTPESTVYSDYDRYSRRSQSPPYDSEYGASPPPIRAFSPYQDRLRDDRREYKRPQARSNGRNSKGMHSSGSENDSLGKVTKKPQRKV